jgi:hypothetical protein
MKNEEEKNRKNRTGFKKGKGGFFGIKAIE